MQLHRIFLTLFVLALGSAAAADAAGVRGHITDPSGLSLPGVVVTLTSVSADDTVTSVTDELGTYLLTAPSGSYSLKAELSGFRSVTRNGIVIPDTTSPLTVDLQLALAPIEQEVTVTAEVVRPLLGDAHPDAPTTVTRDVIDSAMLPNSQYDDVLPLMPNVVRGPDGLISVAGARAPQGALFVNGVNLTDPISGSAGVMLPLEAVEAMQVYSGGYPADLGRATGGVTSVQTRSGVDRFRLALDSFFPRLLYTDDGIRGVAFWDPNGGVSGPLVRDRLYYQQAISYRYDRNRFATLAGPEHNLFNALLSWSEIDARVSDAQHLRFSAGFDPQAIDHANITAFTPETAVPQLEQGGWSAAISDSIIAGGGTALDLRLSMMRTQATVTPAGAAPFDLGHDLLRGSYFDRQDRRGERIEAGASMTHAIGARHTLKLGGSADRGSLDVVDASAPVQMLRSDGAPARVIAFDASIATATELSEFALFAQDTWRVTPWLTVDAGGRFDQARGFGGSVSPRGAWTMKRRDGGTSMSGSVGLFSDKIPLEALAFPLLPGRSEQRFDEAGASFGAPRAHVNAIDGRLTTPQAARWNIELDRHVADRWLLRARYEERHGRNELIVLTSEDPTTSPLTLTSRGTSTARSLESTVGYRAGRDRGELYISYVRSSARGDVNSLDAVEGIFKAPFVQPNQFARLPIDVPNRVLAWGLFHLPSRITVAPFIEVRSGFPFTTIDEDWQYASAPNAFRLPWFGSADLSVNKIVGLPAPLPAARVGVKLYNVASAHTEREVQRDLAREDFGTRYDPIPRDFSIVFEFLWGRR